MSLVPSDTQLDDSDVCTVDADAGRQFSIATVFPSRKVTFCCLVSLVFEVTPAFLVSFIEENNPSLHVGLDFHLLSLV